ncbi:5-(carboxyamino)imidazole ribonucleotide synthase [Sphingomonas colocasiae]|uniref:N5-carboxyaminoimidazole ribonucleotide synthase n=1 Tax=Sphingomonas colocasiae TaxID=1848973 RepID=A0ABS7PNG4_9SPHN|nr:5-(carboxyamino)imidazole ribonucleotide synthase [Sphingomonas colocasiae]MBY8822255.1 5-(carboxyamino)imidazole ribonucleotide synthase [Sphingomonas colocasiae]
MNPLKPGSTIGIIGGGQLGRMLAMAAAQLGYRCHIYAPEADSVAAEVAARFTRAPYEDAASLAAFAGAVDVVTYEFENLPVSALAPLADRLPVHPGFASLKTAQDRLAEKTFMRDLGVRTAPWRAVSDQADLAAAAAEIGLPAILKTRFLGYDGKGQARLMADADIATAFDAIGRQPAILEGFVDFEAEFSILMCRAADGACAFWDAPTNVHRNGILATSIVPPGPLVAAQAEQAREIARRAGEALGHVGVLTLEFFAAPDGPVFNEMAPRVHNSGHWTIEGALTSQFENHIRAVCGLPLGATDIVGRRVTMENLIGAEAEGWAEILADPTAHLHLYGKDEIRAGRKMGHVTRLEV